MEIRLIGTAEECADMAVVLRGCADLEVGAVSEAYPCRRDDGQVRVYVKARLVQLEEVQTR